MASEPAINRDGKFFHKLVFNTELGISFLLTADFWRLILYWCKDMRLVQSVCSQSKGP